MGMPTDTVPTTRSRKIRSHSTRSYFWSEDMTVMEWWVLFFHDIDAALFAANVTGA